VTRTDSISGAAALVLILLSASAGAQMTEHGPAARFYQTSPDFSFDFPGLDRGGSVSIAAAKQTLLGQESLILEGDVTLTYQDVTLKADAITYNRVTGDATAEGNVVLDQGPRRIAAQRAFYNFYSKGGTLFEATASLDPSVYVTGEIIEKLDDVSFRITNGIFTSCELGDPSWSFHLDEGLIRVDDYARLRNVSFRAQNTPVIYLPYVVWPTKRDRARGFLIPKPGFSNRFGTYLKTAYFLPYEEWADATIRADMFSEGFFGLGVESRYVPTESVKGALDLYGVYDADSSEIEWKYAYTHTHEDLPGGFRGVIDIQDYSDLIFFQRYERDFDLNTISNIYSSAYLTKNTSRYAINLRTDRREHFLGFTESQVYEQLPTLQLNYYPKRIGELPLYFSLESSASRLRSTSPFEQDVEYYRGDLFPTVSMQVKTPSWFSIKPEISLRQTTYSKSRDPETFQVSEEALSRFYAQGQVELIGPSLSRIFQRELGGFARFKHVIEPRFRYLYTTDVEEQQRVLRFDTVDSPFLPLVNQSLEYALVQRLLAKEADERSSAREILSLTFRQTVSLAEPFRQSFTPEGGLVESHFTPFRLDLRFNPWRSVRFDATASIGNETNRVDQASVSASLQGDLTYLTTTWFATFAPPGIAAPDSSQIRIATGRPILEDRLRADLQLNYDITENRILEQRYLVGYSSSCYNIAVEYRDFQEFRPLPGVTPGIESRRNRDYQISISLKNVGTFVDVRGSFDALF
jgi:LPS-assembly protein